MDRLAVIDWEVAKCLNEVHKKQETYFNSKKHDGKVYEIGDKVWVIRPKGFSSQDKFKTRWIGPGIIVERPRANSYVVQVEPNRIISAYRDQLKPWIEDTITGNSYPLFFHRGRSQFSGLEGSQEVVQKIVAHRLKDGQLQFHTLWEGTGEDTWEPAENFIDGVCEPWLKYCKEKGLQIPIPGL